MLNEMSYLLDQSRLISGKKLILFLIVFLISYQAYSQDITNTLGTSGTFTIKDASTTFFTLTQSSGLVNITKNLRLENTTSSSVGVVTKGTNRFLHNYGSDNIFLGVNSGNFTMTGYGMNTAMGYLSLNSNTTGSENTAVGWLSLTSNTTGDYNTAVGLSSLRWNYTGDYNTAVGNSSLNNNSGNKNTAVGYSSLYSNKGNENTAVGYFSLNSNTTGSKNTAVGLQSLVWNITGNLNTALGYSSLYSSTGNLNTAVGNYSLYSTTGDSNTALGYYSGGQISTGSNNTTIGNNAQVPDGTLSNQVRIGDTRVSYAGVQVAWTITSDKRWKQDILPINLGLGFISKLNPVSYTRINDENQKTEYGFIAQEIEEVLKENNIDKSGMITIDDNDMYELRYNDLLAPMVKSIQELNEKNESLEKEIQQLKNEVESLKTVNEKLVKLEKLIMDIKVNENEIKEIKSSSK